MRRRIATVSPIVLFFVCLLVRASSVDAAQQTRPEVQTTIHSINDVRLAVDNAGFIGGGYLVREGRYDAFTGEALGLGIEYPAFSQLAYGDIALMVGAIVGRDTLVSAAFTLYDASSLRGAHLELSPSDNLARRSTLHPNSPEYVEAISQEDIVAIFTDTFKTENAHWVGRDLKTNRRHIPLNIEVAEKSYAWSFEYAEDFVLFDLNIKNIGDETLEEAFVGFFVYPEVGHLAVEAPGGDDLCGLLGHHQSGVGCHRDKTLNIAWFADNDGDPVNGQFQVDYRPYRSVPHVAGLRFIGEPPYSGGGEPVLSFNWILFTSLCPECNWGPRRRENFRDFGTGGLGEPLGDNNMYHIMSGGEIDYDVQFTASVEPWDINWLYPPQSFAAWISSGTVPLFYFAVGPFDIPPGGVLSVPFVYVCGENLHTDPNNAARNLPQDPWTYKDNLDFSDLVKNATWAEWIYDNPGVDTDEDGYFGEQEICVRDSAFENGIWRPTIAETLWVKGDGVPDWRAAGPPPAPEIWVTPVENGIHVRYNGHRSETEVDIFSRIVDFEGYRIYLGRETRYDNMSLVASYDRQDYDKWIWRLDLDTAGKWQVEGVPYTLDSLRCLYGRPPDPCNDMTFDPLSTAPHIPFNPPDFPESTFYFVEHEYNASDLGFNTPITKIYPDAPDPSHFHPDSIPDEHYTDDGYLKFYEYEYTITDLLPTVPYYVNVTAFDFGSPTVRLDALETSRTLGAKEIYPLTPGASPTASGKLNVYIYPNPYRIDGNYRDHGFEGRMREDRPDYRVREIHFANLPAKCKISIFSLDGDLIRSIDHDVPESDPNHTHDSWDMITRNTQEPVSGLYYWVVEASDGRTQIGKLVLIM